MSSPKPQVLAPSFDLLIDARNRWRDGFGSAGKFRIRFFWLPPRAFYFRPAAFALRPRSLASCRPAFAICRTGGGVVCRGEREASCRCPRICLKKRKAAFAGWKNLIGFAIGSSTGIAHLAARRVSSKSHARRPGRAACRFSFSGRLKKIKRCGTSPPPCQRRCSRCRITRRGARMTVHARSHAGTRDGGLALLVGNDSGPGHDHGGGRMC